MQSGFHTFKDDDEIERGESIESELQKAIEQSRISIIVFSKDYASSRWCLDELVKILHHMKISRHEVLPVFYDVEPSEVRNQTGSFAEAFVKYERQLKAVFEGMESEMMEKVERWRAALKEVANLGGMVLQNETEGYESKFIQKVVEVVGQKLKRRALNMTPHLIGIDALVLEISMWLLDGSTDVGIMAVYGIGGIGKTTIAQVVYNQNFEKFDDSYFIENVSEISKQPNGLVLLQRQLLSSILKGRKEEIYSVGEGMVKIKDALCCKRVLLVLDDVDKVDQLDTIIYLRHDFCPGSRIIITTRHKSLIRAYGISEVREVENLDEEESLELFSWHAFGQNNQPDGYVDISRRFVNYCGGLPLALKVLGSSQFGNSIDLWESGLERLEAIPDDQIHEKLKISYDSLQDNDKKIFLDIACFFVGKDKDFITTILDGCEFFTKTGIHNLADRCLLTINKGNKLMMHRLIQDMGREIIRQESCEPGKCSRLWRQKDVLDVLIEKTGTYAIEGLSLNLHVRKEDKPAEAFFPGKNPKKRHSEDADKLTLRDEGNSSKPYLGFFSWLPINSSLINYLPKSDEVLELETDAFSSMRKLRLLQLNNIWLKGGYARFPKKLRWLCWRGFPLKCIPNEMPLESLVALDMQYSRLEEPWKGIKLLRFLKIFNLSYSHGLIRTPDFSKLPNIERLILKGCINLVEVHESIGESRRLVFLNLEGCQNLRKIPPEMGQLKSLETLIVVRCSKLHELPMELANMESLRVLYADGINQISPTTGDKPWYAQCSWVSKVQRNPGLSLAYLPQRLVRVSLEGCNICYDMLPRDLGNLSSLEYLNLDQNPFSTLPESIRDLTKLSSLSLIGCPRLISLPELPMSLKYLTVMGCTSLEMLSNLPNLPELFLNVDGCNNLVEVEEMFTLVPLGQVDVRRLKCLGLVELESMENLRVKLHNSVTEITKYYPLQGLYEYCVFSIFLPGSEVPEWFRNNESALFSTSMCSHHDNHSSSISFGVPSLSNLKVQALNVCAIYSGCLVYRIIVTNETKGLNWRYHSTFLGFPDHGMHTIWLSHWRIGNRVEVGDVLTVTVDHENSVTLKEVEIQVLYDSQEDLRTKHLPHLSDWDVFHNIYYWRPGRYLSRYGTYIVD